MMVILSRPQCVKIAASGLPYVIEMLLGNYNFSGPIIGNEQLQFDIDKKFCKIECILLI